jgi:predicted Zn-dependent peptidase
VRYERAWLTPNNATHRAVGSLDVVDIERDAERVLGTWATRYLAARSAKAELEPQLTKLGLTLGEVRVESVPDR